MNDNCRNGKNCVSKTRKYRKWCFKHWVTGSKKLGFPKERISAVCCHEEMPWLYTKNMKLKGSSGVRRQTWETGLQEIKKIVRKSANELQSNGALEIHTDCS